MRSHLEAPVGRTKMEKVLSEVGGLMPHFHCITEEKDIFRIIQGEAVRQ